MIIMETQPDKFFKVHYRILDDNNQLIRKEVHRVRGPVMPNPSSLVMVHPERVAIRGIEEIDEEEFNTMPDSQVVE